MNNRGISIVMEDRRREGLREEYRRTMMRELDSLRLREDFRGGQCAFAF